MPRKECATCDHLKTCTEVTEDKLLRHHTCPHWKVAEEEELETREGLIKDFGLWVLRYEVLAFKNKSTKHRRTRRRRH